MSPELPRLLTRERKWRLAALVVNGLAQAAAMVVIAIIMQSMIDGLVSSSSDTGIWTSAGLMTFATLVIGWLKRREKIDAETMGQDYVADIRIKVFRHVSQLSARALGESRKGFVLLRFVNDLTALRQWVTLGLSRLAVSGVVLVASMTALAVMNPVLGGALFALILVGMVGSVMLGRSIDATMRESRRRRANIAANLTEKLEHMLIVQAFAQRTNERRKVQRQTRSLKRAMIARAESIGTFRALVYVVVGMALTISVIVGSMLVRADQATVGQIMAALGLVSLITPSLFDFGRVYEYRKSAVIAYEKTAKLLQKGPIIASSSSPRRLGNVSGGLTFDAISVKGGLQDFSAHVEPGSRVLISGPNGAGKSTLLMLAMRLIEPDAGRVLIDGRDIRKIKTGHLRKAVSIASPTLPLLRGTIRSNIAYGSKTATDDEVAEAAARCGMDGLNQDSTYWLDAAVDEGGRNLSAGERMRVILARAIVGSPSILLLDEPDSHLDSEGMDVLKALVRDYPGTVVAATHSPSLKAILQTEWQLEPGSASPAEEAA